MNSVIDQKPGKKWLILLNKPLFRMFLFIVTCFTLVAAILLLLRKNPVENPLAPTCSFYALTGLYCPACGMTRALYHATHGHFREAFSYNILWPGIVLFLTACMSMWFYWIFTGKSPFHAGNRLLNMHPSITWIILILLFSFWILRNIPVYPFTLLAP